MNLGDFYKLPMPSFDGGPWQHKDVRALRDPQLMGPLFLWDQPRTADEEYEKINQDMGYFGLPFEQFKILARTKEGDKFAVWVTTGQNQGGDWVPMFWGIKHMLSGITAPFKGGLFGAFHGAQLEKRDDSGPSIFGSVHLKVGQGWEAIEMKNPQGMDVFKIGDMHYRTLWEIEMLIFQFCIDFFRPTNFIAEVKPLKEGKSVEWRRSRKHFVIVDKDHPANHIGVTKGQEIKDDEEHAMQRMAHSRRAHFRTLRAARYGDNVGKKIFIRATWVGPKEWKQNDSIYVLRDDLEAFREEFKISLPEKS